MTTATVNGVHSSNVDTRDQLLARLAEPTTIEALNRLLDRLEFFTFLLDALDGFLRRGETVTDAVAESLGEFRKAAPADLTDLLARLPSAGRTAVDLAEFAARPGLQDLLRSGLVERLAQPTALSALNSLVSNLELIALLISGLDGFIRRSEVILDVLGDSLREISKATPAAPQQPTLDLPGLIRSTTKLLASGGLDKLQKLLDAYDHLERAGMFEENTLRLLGEVGRIAAQTRETTRALPPTSIGLFGLWRLLGDPEIQKALAHGIAFARAYGQQLSGPAAKS